MTHDRKKITRRDALTALGTAAAAGVLMTATSREVHAQASTLSFIVDTYRAYYHSAPQYSWEARIILYSADHAQQCVLYFMKEGQAMPANTVSAGGNSANVYFAHSRLGEIREFLRNERPVRVTIAVSNGIATLSNEDYELVGDADI
jgi:hypothetical protein